MPLGNGILTLAVKRLTDFLIKEAAFLLEVNDELESIRDELILMQAFLKDAEQKKNADERILWWIDEIRSIAFKTEAIIDAYYKEVKGKEPSKKKLLTTSFRKCFCIAGESNVYDLGKEVEALKNRLSDISRMKETYGISNIDNTQERANAAARDQGRLWDQRITTSSDDEEHDFVGFEDDFNQLQTRLSSSDVGRCAISIVGMGGSGKTSIARKLYNTNKSRFELHAWVCVFQEGDTGILLARIINSLKEPDELKEFEKMDKVVMKGYLRTLLGSKRYLVVIDDVWDRDACEFLKSALPDYRNSSRVIVTTRNGYVAWLSDGRTYLHTLGRLGPEESWKLFCKKAFYNQNGVCPRDLEKVGKEMVARCDGLPLTITVLAGHLCRKESHEWHFIKKDFWKVISKESTAIPAMFNLSYNDLSSDELKLCYLYLGVFPEDYEISSEKLVQLWIAEDLIKSEERDLEKLAESYITELNDRSLIQLIKNQRRPNSTCRVYDLFRYLAVNKAKGRDFFLIYDESMNPATKLSSVKRIAFRSGFERYMAIEHSYPQVHTLSFLNYQGLLDDDHATKLLTLINTNSKSLRVLDLEGVRIQSKLKLFESKEKLVNLRYLGFSQTVIDILPESVRDLQALQAMDVSSKSDEKILLPRDICQLKQLRHLRGSFETIKGDILVPSTSLKDLTNFNYLNIIDISGWLPDEESHKSALNAFSGLCYIRMLSLSFNTNHRLSIEPLCCCTNLIQLELSGRIKSLPMGLDESLPNLRYLSLRKAQFEQDPLPALGMVPHLLVLTLDGFILTSLIISATGFSRLESLSIGGFPEDMNLEIEENALPNLKHIHIGYLKNFTLPERLRDL